MYQFEDSTGKSKPVDARSRSAVLSAVFILGVCLGVIASERLYLNTQDRVSRIEPVASVRSRKLEMAVAVDPAVHRPADAIVPSLGGAPQNELEALLRELAPGGEVMIVISNITPLTEGTLRMWLECVTNIDSKKWLVVAIDEALRDHCREHGIPHYYRPVQIPATQAKTGDNHAISAMKYEIIEEFLTLGWHVLLSDVDIAVIQDPFDHLHRDSDVEGMSDGFNEQTAYGEIYGIDDEAMGWSRYAQGFQHMAFNSGLFYVRASRRTVALMQRIAQRLREAAEWDQSVYNEQIFMLSHGDYRSTQLVTRVMDIDLFMNSKRLFRTIRYLPPAKQRLPVMVHVNYHPDKPQRMAAAIAYFSLGDKNALKKFPGGSEPGS